MSNGEDEPIGDDQTVEDLYEEAEQAYQDLLNDTGDTEDE